MRSVSFAVRKVLLKRELFKEERKKAGAPRSRLDVVQYQKLACDGAASCMYYASSVVCAIVKVQDREAMCKMNAKNVQRLRT